MDFSDSMIGIVKAMSPGAEMVIDRLHVAQLAGKRLEEMRLKLKRLAMAEAKGQELEFNRNGVDRPDRRPRWQSPHAP